MSEQDRTRDQGGARASDAAVLDRHDKDRWTVAGIKAAARAEARAQHGDVFPEGFRFYFRRYGKHGGRWRGVGPNGWVESDSEDAARDETWWMVAAHEADQRAGVK